MTQLIKAPATKPDDLNLEKKKNLKKPKSGQQICPLLFRESFLSPLKATYVCTGHMPVFVFASVHQQMWKLEVFFNYSAV